VGFEVVEYVETASKADAIRELDALARAEVDQGVVANLVERDDEPAARERATEACSAGVVGEGRTRIAEAAEDPVAGGDGGGGHEEPGKRGRVVKGDAAPVFAEGGEPDAVGEA
jgi:hypothetical protein